MQSTISETVTPSRPLQRTTRAWRCWPAPRIAAASGIAALSGLAAAASLPRGPTTGTEVAFLMLGTLVAGAVVGLALRFRWAVVAGPALHLAAFELGRFTVFEVAGPTLDRPRFDVTMGVLVFLAAHVMYAAVALAPMALGAVAGVAVVRLRHGGRRAEPRTGLRRAVDYAGLGTRWALTSLLALAVGALGVQLLRPGQVAPILGPDGTPVPGSIATMEKLRLGGVDQWVSIRGRSVTNPVLLHLSGGPGSSDVGWVRTFNRPLEEQFTVVVWEQRGVGKSYPALDPTATFTLDRIVSDGVELTRWRRSNGSSCSPTPGTTRMPRSPHGSTKS